jgi:hypothetical protein
MNAKSLFLGAATVMAMTACGEEADERSSVLAVRIDDVTLAVPSGPPVPRDQFCDEVAKALCLGSASCCDSSALEDDDECTAAATERCNGTYGWMLDNPDFEFDEIRAGGLVAALLAEADTCRPALGRTEFPDPRLVFRGTVPPGQPCIPSKVGSNCREGHFCLGLTQLCVPLGIEGDACKQDAECQAGFVCTQGSTGKHACQAQAYFSEPCQSDRDCHSGLVCDVDGRCDEPKLGQEGDPCDWGARPCGLGLACGDGTIGVEDARCVPALLPEGAPCGPSHGPCRSDLWCREEANGPVCVRDDALSRPCFADTDCEADAYCAFEVDDHFDRDQPTMRLQGRCDPLGRSQAFCPKGW